MTPKIDTSTIRVERVIVHDIPKHKKGDIAIEPNYSLTESKVPDGLRVFFRDKLIQALSSDRAFKIVFDDDNTSPVSWLVGEMLSQKGENLVIQSKEICKHLFQIQQGVNAAGIIVVIFGKISSNEACFILKLEKDMGAQLTMDPVTKSYDITEVKDLMLTQKTKIFKVSMFVSREKIGLKFDGIIMDYQIDIAEKREVTTWFIDRFLGCKAYEDPKITTQKFYFLTKTFIETLEDPLDQAKYLQDLNSYVQKNVSTLSPKVFAEDYLKNADHKNKYKRFLDSKRFKFSSFPKDTTQIERHVKKITLSFENGISIIGKKGTFDKNVKLEPAANGKTRAEIVSKIQKIK